MIGSLSIIGPVMQLFQTLPEIKAGRGDPCARCREWVDRVDLPFR
jgi:hypothetical protein